MPGPELFSNLGLFIRRGFINPHECRQFIIEAEQAPHLPTSIWSERQAMVVPSVRQAGDADISLVSRARLIHSIESLLPELKAHFDVSLTGLESPRVLVYRPGNFYRPHIDTINSGDGSNGSSDGKTAPTYLKNRKVSLVLFLNGKPDYSGGALTFFGLMVNRWKNFGLSLEGEPGLLIAFPSSVPHEVQTVTSGLRVTVAGWCF